MNHSIIVLAVALSMPACFGAVSFTGTTISQTFTGYDGTAGPTGWDANGFSSGPGFSERRGSSSGGVGTGGAYAFDVGGGNVALGVQPAGSDFTPGYFQLEVTNDSGAALTAVELGFTGYYYNDQPTANSLALSYSTDGTSFIPIGGASFVSPELADAAGWTVGVAYSGSVAVSIPDGGSLFLRWDGNDVSGSGARDEFALDDVSFGAPVPEPSAALLSGLAFVGLFRRKR
ncbi:MAG: PEP-CTERM sorting domain-containing protein [Akkermansiaceae bacterium]